MKRAYKAFNLKALLPFFPEIIFSLILCYFIIESLIWALSSTELTVWSDWLPGLLGLAFLMTFLFQYRWKSLIVSWIQSCLIGFGSLWMILAAISEFSEFPSGSREGFILLGVGCSIFTTTGLLALYMPWKYKKSR